MSKNFSCLDKDFSISMNCNQVKEQLIKDVPWYLQKTERLSLHPLQKIEICQLHVFSKLKWRFTKYNLNIKIFKISQNIDYQLSKYYRKWLHLPVSTNVTHLFLRGNKLGLNVKTTKLIRNECKVSVRRVLKCSVNEVGEL